jgi:nicotinate phosphoribosyltransferase
MSVGTMAHEFIMTVGQGYLKHNPAFSNWYALDAWVKEYGTMNGIALTDTIGTDVFLRDFKKTFATVFSGVRHDSGDPFAWGDKIIAHYKSLGIDPMTKTLMFSDGLNLKKATELNEYFKGKAQVAFGIGTDWSGPQGIDALNIVCKVAIVNGLDVAKLSDAEGKNMCRNPAAIEHLKNEIAWRMATDK